MGDYETRSSPLGQRIVTPKASEDRALAAPENAADSRVFEYDGPGNSGDELAEFWLANYATLPMHRRLSAYKTMMSSTPTDVEQWRRVMRRAGSRAAQDEQLEKFRLFLNEGFLREIQADPIGAGSELSKFRTTYNRKDPVIEGMAKQLYLAMGSGISDKVTSTVHATLAKAKTAPPSGPFYKALTEEALSPWSDHDREFEAIVRSAFFDAVQLLVAETHNAKIAVGFIKAATDVLPSRSDDPIVLEEVKRFSNQLRDSVGEDPVLSKTLDGVHQQGQVANATANVVSMEGTINHHKDLKQDAEIKYLAMYIAIKQAFEMAGNAWIEERTSVLRTLIGTMDTFRTGLSRGVNTAWALCGGPATAVPIVVVGLIADVVSELLQKAKKLELEELETHLKDELARSLSKHLSGIYVDVDAQFAKIDKGELPLMSKMVSIGNLQAIFSRELKQELDKIT